MLLLCGCSVSPLKVSGHSSEDIKATATKAEQSYGKGDWAAAADAYGVLVKQTPQDTDLWFRYANALARSDQPDQAVAAYREVVARDAHYAKAWFNMGIVQLRQSANSFSRMGGNVTADDPMRKQGEQVYAAIMKIIGDDNGARRAPAAATSAQGVTPGPLAPAAPDSHDVGGDDRP